MIAVANLQLLFRFTSGSCGKMREVRILGIVVISLFFVKNNKTKTTRTLQMSTGRKLIDCNLNICKILKLKIGMKKLFYARRNCLVKFCLK